MIKTGIRGYTTLKLKTKEEVAGILAADNGKNRDTCDYFSLQSSTVGSLKKGHRASKLCMKMCAMCYRESKTETPKVRTLEKMIRIRTTRTKFRLIHKSFHNNEHCLLICRHVHPSASSVTLTDTHVRFCCPVLIQGQLC